MKKFLSMLMLMSLSTVQSCRNDNVTEPGPTPEPQAERGVFIVNEGSFPNAGSVSFYNIKKDSVIQAVVNSSSGWITPNDARVLGTKLYVVVN